VCVFVWERERERGRERVWVCDCECVSVGDKFAKDSLVYMLYIRETPMYVVYIRDLWNIQHIRTCTFSNCEGDSITRLFHCNTLQHTATHCNTLQHTATHCNILSRVCLSPTHNHTFTHTLTHLHTHTRTHTNTETPSRWLNVHVRICCIFQRSLIYTTYIGVSHIYNIYTRDSFASLSPTPSRWLNVHVRLYICSVCKRPCAHVRSAIVCVHDFSMRDIIPLWVRGMRVAGGVFGGEICVTWIYSVCNTWLICMWRDIFVCDMTYLCVCDLQVVGGAIYEMKCVTGSIACVAHDSFVCNVPYLCVTWLIRDLTHSWLDSFVSRWYVHGGRCNLQNEMRDMTL